MANWREDWTWEDEPYGSYDDIEFRPLRRAHWGLRLAAVLVILSPWVLVIAGLNWIGVL